MCLLIKVSRLDGSWRDSRVEDTPENVLSSMQNSMWKGTYLCSHCTLQADLNDFRVDMMFEAAEEED